MIFSIWEEKCYECKWKVCFLYKWSHKNVWSILSGIKWNVDRIPLGKATRMINEQPLWHKVKEHSSIYESIFCIIITLKISFSITLRKGIMPKLLFKGKENQDEKEYLSWKHFCNNNAFQHKFRVCG